FGFFRISWIFWILRLFWISRIFRVLGLFRISWIFRVLRLFRISWIFGLFRLLWILLFYSKDTIYREVIDNSGNKVTFPITDNIRPFIMTFLMIHRYFFRCVVIY